jgi:4-amino-4-deoxy-L-arabinose transferase-like glycosyltransferase
LPRRLAQLLLAGVVMLAVSFAWIGFVELTPTSQRPYIGSSSNNTELGLTFEYNGFGRVEGQLGGPGTEKVRAGAFVPADEVLFPFPPGTPRATALARELARKNAEPRPGVHASARPAKLGGREVNPIPFGGSPGPLRLFGRGLGDQGGWLVPFALFGLLALAALLTWERRAGTGDVRGSRRDPRLATLLVLGGWFLVEAVVLSASKGIVHPYYVSALAPGTAAMVGAGAAAIAGLARGGRRLSAVALALGAFATSAAGEIVLMHREHYMLWFVPLLIGGLAACLGALALARRLAPAALAVALALVLVTPAAYASTTWLAPVEGTFPVAGSTHDAGAGGYGVGGSDLAIDRALMRYVRTHRPGSRWALLTVSSDEAAPMMLMGLKAGALAGYSGTDQALTGPGLARLVRTGAARYVVLGGDYSMRGGNGATRAVLRACRQLRSSVWDSPAPYANGLVLFDCAGEEAALARS